MKKTIKGILILSFAFALVLCFTACGGNDTSETATTVPDAQNTNTSDKPSTPDPSDLRAEDGDDVSTDALDAAMAAEKGATDKLSGKYALEGSEGTFYVFGEDGSYLLRTGTYEPKGGKVILQYGDDEGWDYEVTEAAEGSYNLMRNGQLIPLTFKDGFDGISGKKLFSGVYQFGGSDNVDWVFAKDGSMSEVSVLDAKVKEDTVKIAGSEYTWAVEDGKVLIQTNGSTVMTLVPAE